MIKETLETILSTQNIEKGAEAAFKKEAHFLMNNCLLQIGSEKYRLI